MLLGCRSSRCEQEEGALEQLVGAQRFRVTSSGWFCPAPAPLPCQPWKGTSGQRLCALPSPQPHREAPAPLVLHRGHDHCTVAEPDLLKACAGADILLFVVPHQFISQVCDQLKGHMKKDAVGVSLIKGVDEGPDGLRLISDIIHEKLGIEMSVLMGANLANEVAEEKFCETTIGCKNIQHGQTLKELMQTPNFRVTVVQDTDTVEICGALKNVVAVGAGFCDGLGYGDNTKAAVIRLGLMEMIAFAKLFCKGPVASSTFLESCGVADLITTCYGGRNRKVAEAFARTGKTIEQLEKEILNGQKVQGPPTSAELHRILKAKNMVDKFPLFTAVYQICYEGKPVTDVIKCLQNHPEHM
uniref:Glycerol-3-phosphate dehydrogenase [NAD(+)] n=1 Tax=Bubo bubo TaxID=30461 RepID=A0A8C0FRE9_BUBBB